MNGESYRLMDDINNQLNDLMNEFNKNFKE